MSVGRHRQLPYAASSAHAFGVSIVQLLPEHTFLSISVLTSDLLTSMVTAS